LTTTFTEVTPAPTDEPTGVGGLRPTKPKVRLGEELPIFCEKCGYSLHGLPQGRCERCTILQYHCPECGHHQPINTLRPAAQRMLGRIRAFALGLWVLFKLNFFGWLLFAWFGMGMAWSYNFRSRQLPTPPPPAAVPAGAAVPAPVVATPTWTYELVPRPVDIEASTAFACFAIAFSTVGRMLLLRWGRGWIVGLVLAALVLAAVQTGAWCRQNIDGRWTHATGPPGADFHLLTLGGAGAIVFGAMVVWPIWLALTHLFLPSKTAAALLDWQRSLSQKEFRKEPALA
jgi:hypothetical protein